MAVRRKKGPWCRMKVLILEDEDKKYGQIYDIVQLSFSAMSLDITRCIDLNSAMVKIGTGKYDLFIADLIVPQMPGGHEVDATEQLCAILESEPVARLPLWVVISRFGNALSAAKESFAHHGVTILDYRSDDKWRVGLEIKLSSIAGASQYDFAIFCALEKERAAFGHAQGVVMGDLFSACGLNCQKMEISSKRGVCIRTPQMGLVDSAIACARALEMFKPRAVAMSGICGGRKSEVGIGTLIVPEMCWNYQTGKFSGGSLRFEPNSVSIPACVNTALSQLLADPITLNVLRSGLISDDKICETATMQPLVSGSSVLADASAVDELGLQHRKVAGVDMEMYSIFRAASQYYDTRAIFFGAKTVVDLADENKSDKYHEYGCIVSARFVSAGLDKVLVE